LILINEKNWEPVNTAEDVIKIVRNYYNWELADEMEKIMTNIEDEIEELRRENEYLSEEIYDLQNQLIDYI
jgi:cell division protein FtsB